MFLKDVKKPVLQMNGGNSKIVATYVKQKEIGHIQLAVSDAAGFRDVQAVPQGVKMV